MGFYECVYECGDGCYCVSIGSSLDNFESTSWIFCSKHKDPNSRKVYYDLTNFTRKFSNKITRTRVTAKVVDTKLNARNILLTKLELNLTPDEFNKLELKDSKKLYFSEFDDEPSWQIIEEKIYIIDGQNQFNTTESIESIDSPLCTDRNIIFNWQTNKVQTIDEYNTWKIEYDKKSMINKNIN